MTLTRALVEILLSPYPEVQSTANIFDFSAASSQERAAIVPADARKASSDTGSCCTERRLWQVPDVVNESGHVALNVLDVADKATGNAPDTDSPMVSSGGGVTVISSPLYLLASEIVDLVEFDHQYRAEEEIAAEEGALIEARGYSDPKNEGNGRY